MKLSVQEFLDLIREVEIRDNEPTPQPRTMVLTDSDVRNLVACIQNIAWNNRIKAIKFFRAASGLGLRESKEFCDSIASYIVRG